MNKTFKITVLNTKTGKEKTLETDLYLLGANGGDSIDGALESDNASSLDAGYLVVGIRQKLERFVKSDPAIDAAVKYVEALEGKTENAEQ